MSDDALINDIAQMLALIAKTGYLDRHGEEPRPTLRGASFYDEARYIVTLVRTTDLHGRVERR